MYSTSSTSFSFRAGAGAGVYTLSVFLTDRGWVRDGVFIGTVLFACGVLVANDLFADGVLDVRAGLAVLELSGWRVLGVPFVSDERAVRRTAVLD